jgi:hypothetical protein
LGSRFSAVSAQLRPGQQKSVRWAVQWHCPIEPLSDQSNNCKIMMSCVRVARSLPALARSSSSASDPGKKPRALEIFKFSVYVVLPIGVAWIAQDPKRLKVLAATFNKETYYPPETVDPAVIHNSMKRGKLSSDVLARLPPIDDSPSS